MIDRQPAIEIMEEIKGASLELGEPLSWVLLSGKPRLFNKPIQDSGYNRSLSKAQVTIDLNLGIGTLNTPGTSRFSLFNLELNKLTKLIDSRGIELVNYQLSNITLSDSTSNPGRVLYTNGVNAIESGTYSFVIDILGLPLLYGTVRKYPYLPITNPFIKDISPEITVLIDPWTFDFDIDLVRNTIPDLLRYTRPTQETNLLPII